MSAHRTRPEHCIVPECPKPADVNGTARGWCAMHYNRWRRYGWCETAYECAQPATNHLGLCNEHTPAGLPI